MTQTLASTESTQFIAPDKVIEIVTESAQGVALDQAIGVMIELRIQLAQLKQKIQALQPAFFAACLALNTDKITLERATISRRLSPGQWAYSATIVEQEDWLKNIKQLFKQTHEPIGGREVTWTIKLLLFTL